MHMGLVVSSVPTVEHLLVIKMNEANTRPCIDLFCAVGNLENNHLCAPPSCWKGRDNSACFTDNKEVALVPWVCNGSLSCIYLISFVAVIQPPDIPFLSYFLLLLLQRDGHADVPLMN